MSWTVRDRIPVVARFPAPVQTGPGGPPSLLRNAKPILFPGGKAAWAWCLPSTASTAEVKERVVVYLYSTSGPSWSVLG